MWHLGLLLSLWRLWWTNKKNIYEKRVWVSSVIRHLQFWSYFRNILWIRVIRKVHQLDHQRHVSLYCSKMQITQPWQSFELWWGSMLTDSDAEGSLIAEK